MAKHDLIVIGAGPGGYVAAIRAAQLGMNVASIDKNDQLGGTCLRVGCIPSKALLESSERFYEVQESYKEHGIGVEGVTLDLETMLGRKDKVVKSLTDGVAFLFKKNKITRYQGVGEITGEGRVTVHGEDGDTELTADNIIIATGSKVASLPGVELDGDRVGTSTEALDYGEVPEHLVVIGAGYIGLELGSVWKRLGAKVTVLEYLDRILPGMDAEIAKEALKIFKKQGLEFRLGAKVNLCQGRGRRVYRRGGGPGAYHLRPGCWWRWGASRTRTGWGWSLSGSSLTSVAASPVDDRFKTAVDGIYAIGDVIRGPMLAHKGEEEGIACVEGIAGRLRPRELRRDSGGRLHGAGDCFGGQDRRRTRGRGRGV